jgi:hypothetical protein
MTALRARLSLVDGLSVQMAQTGNINPPYAFLGPPVVDSYRKSFAGNKMNISPTITILTSSAFDEIGVRRLIEYMAPTGDKSIVAIIEADRTLGGVVEDTRVIDFQPYGPQEYGAVGFYGGTFNLEIMARGDG